MVTHSAADEVKKLGELRDEGLLTDEEFQAQKVHVLDQSQLRDVVRPPILPAISVVQPPRDAPHTIPSKEGRMTPTRWVNLTALIGCLLGLLMAWATAFIASVSGLDTDDGKFFGTVVVATALITLWRVRRTNRLNGILVTAAWIGLVAFAVAEIVHLSSTQYVMVGTGLYVDAAAAVVGAVTAVIDLAHNWSSTSSMGIPPISVGAQQQWPTEDAPVLASPGISRLPAGAVPTGIRVETAVQAVAPLATNSTVGSDRTCPLGHPVSGNATFCPGCARPVQSADAR